MQTAPCSRPRLTPLSPVKSTSRNDYRSLKRKVPRQTNFNKKRRVEKHASPCPVAEEDSEDDRSPVEVTDESFTPFDNQPTENEIESQQHLLFPGSALTVNTNTALFQTLMCRHHFTHQAKADSLRIMQIFLPGAQIPSSVYAFDKCTKSADSSNHP